MAENARIAVFKVLDQFGMGKTGDSLRALEWIKRNHKKYDIKILNFSVGYLPDSKLTEKQKILEAEKETEKSQNIVSQSIGYTNVSKDSKADTDDISDLVDDIFG